jgi:hypothetical protein
LAVAFDRAERTWLIARYAAGPHELLAAWRRVPPEARRFRPGPNEWSPHEIVVHCADSEANGALRIRYLMAEPEPRIIGYDQDRWAIDLDYHAHPVKIALAVVAAVRANTVPLIEALPESAWDRAGHHSESGHYTAETWLRTYAAHLHDHAEQIDRSVVAWRVSQHN